MRKPNEMKKFVKILIYIVILLVSSCIPQKRLEILQDKSQNQILKYNKAPVPELRIKPNDMLLIKVSSFDDVSFNYFENQDRSAGYSGGDEFNLASISYAVSDSGYIYYPIIGEFKVEGLTLNEASVILQKKLSAYFDQPNVIVKYAYNKITILGEVNNPGYFNYSKNSITIFDALGIAGGISVHGDVRDIVLIRTFNNETSKTKLNLTSDDIIASEYYYLKPDDILYVRPRNSVKWSTISTPISLVLSSITTTILVLTYSERF